MERAEFEQWKAKEVARLLALVETERRYYQEMVASLPVGLAVLSAERVIVSVNRAFRRVFGLRIEDLRGKSIDQIVPSERLTEQIRSAHIPGTLPPDFFLEAGERFLHVAIVPIRNWDEESEVETLLMVEDLSAIERLRGGPVPAPPAGEEAPAVQAETPPVAPAILDVPAIIWQADAETLAFFSVSGDAEQLLGFPVAHWLATPQFFIDRIHPADRAETLHLYHAAIERGGDASAEYRALSASGAEIWCRETIRHSPGAKTLTGIITDIHRRKQLEDQLLTAQRNDALHNLASRLSHDLNNPLMIVTGYGEEMLHSLDAEDPMRADLEQILAATERIAGITGQLLEFTHHHADLAHPMAVSSLLSRLEEKIAHAVGPSVALEIAPMVEPVWAIGDPEQLEQILLILVSPQREGAEERTRVTIECSAAAVNEHLKPATLAPGLYSRIVIHDNGRGVDAQKRAVFFESILAAKTPAQGAGTALARAYAIVREWGGDIGFFSEPFRGSTFSIYLPYHEPEPAAEAPPPVTPAAAIPEPVVEPVVEPPRATILVVEDEPGIRALVRKILRRERYEVLEAGSGEEALRQTGQGGRVDLLLTDVMLPGMTGRELAERMRETIPSVKVLYVSGYTDDEAVRIGAFPPGSKFLQKPFTLGALVGKVRETLDA